MDFDLLWWDCRVMMQRRKSLVDLTGIKRRQL